MRPSTLPCIEILALVSLFLLRLSVSGEPNLYADHCSSFVPEANVDMNSDPDNSFPLFQPQLHRGYYSGSFLNVLKTPTISHPSSSGNVSSGSSNRFTFQTWDVQKTIRQGILKVEADVVFSISTYYTEVFSSSGTFFSSLYHRSSRRKRIRSHVQFRLTGFWSETNNNLCMVGSSFANEGDTDTDLGLKAVLKLEHVEKSAKITTLVTGTFESLSSSGDREHHFDTISLLMFPQGNYQYTLVNELKDTGSTVDTIKTRLPLGSLSGDGTFCSVFYTLGYSMKLKPAANCNNTVKECSFFGDGINSLPSTMSWRTLECSEGDRKVRLLLSANPLYYGSISIDNMTMIGEGRWVDSKNLLEIIACRIHTDGGSFSSALIEDCSIYSSFFFPSTWSIKQRDNMVGEIRSTKSKNEFGYFAPIAVRDRSGGVSYSKLKYQYTEVKRVQQLCPTKKQETTTRMRKTYPDKSSRDFNFNMAVEDPKGKKIVSGYSYPVFVGNTAYQSYYGGMASNGSRDYINTKVNSSTKGRVNIAYQMSLTMPGSANFSSPASASASLINGSSVSNGWMDIFAEGVYDMDTGELCMVGCRSLETSEPGSVDCEIHIKFQFPPVDSKKAKDNIKGIIESTRERSDPLYFARLNVSASAFYAEWSASSLWRIDLELSLVLISNTLSCIFVGLQILYVRKHPQVLPCASLLMLTILTLGSGIPLTLNFEAFFLENRNQQNIYIDRGAWLEANEVLVRAATLIAFLFQFRLLQLNVSSRWPELGGLIRSKDAEKKVVLLSLPLYATGAFAVMIINVNYSSGNSTWETLRCYAGLVLDGFLLPQILLNMFRDSTEKALSNGFFIGMTLVRLLPHGYDLYRGRNFMQTQFDGSYVYSIPEADFFSTAWDVIIPLGGIILAAIVYIQQRYGGCCIIPRRFRFWKSSIHYEKVSTVVTEA